MTLMILDESGQEINEDNPLITEHDGGTGDTVTRSLTLINKSDYHYYRGIQISVNSVFPVTARILVDELAPMARAGYFDRNEVFPFKLQLSVEPDTLEQVVRGIKLCVSGTRFLSFYGDMEK